MLRLYSLILFGLALATVLLLRAFAVPAGWILLAAGCVIVTACLTDLSPVRSSGLASLAGLFILFLQLFRVHPAGSFLILLTIALLLAAVVLAICADFNSSQKEDIHR